VAALPWCSPAPDDPGLDRLAVAAGLDWLDAAFAYDRLASRIVVAAKNGGRRDVLIQLAAWLPAAGGPFDVVTWVPASRQRRRRRGYDQGRVLARHCGRRIGVGSRCLLARPRDDGRANRSRADRLAGPWFVATARCPPRVLLIDDVATTGASLVSAAGALRAVGARFVAASVLASVGEGAPDARSA
jgi:predicted amidophosphoribosyltransferase